MSSVPECHLSLLASPVSIMNNTFLIQHELKFHGPFTCLFTWVRITYGSIESYRPVLFWFRDSRLS